MYIATCKVPHNPHPEWTMPPCIYLIRNTQCEKLLYVRRNSVVLGSPLLGSLSVGVSPYLICIPADTHQLVVCGEYSCRIPLSSMRVVAASQKFKFVSVKVFAPNWKRYMLIGTLHSIYRISLPGVVRSKQSQQQRGE